MEKLLLPLVRLLSLSALVPVIGVVMVAVLYAVPKHEADLTTAAAESPGAGTMSVPPVTAYDLPGWELFRSNCQQCHALDEVVVGPAMSGVTRRLPKRLWAPLFGQGSRSIVLRSGYYRKLMAQYGNQHIHPWLDFGLTRDEVQQLYIFAEALADGPPPVY